LPATDGRFTRQADVARRIMNEDVADGLLLDVRGISMADLLLDDEDSGLVRALNRLLSSNVDTRYNSFSSSI
jgi:hypothetical protein